MFEINFWIRRIVNVVRKKINNEKYFDREVVEFNGSNYMALVSMTYISKIFYVFDAMIRILPI